MSTRTISTVPHFSRGDRVVVQMPALRAWEGVVIDVKPAGSEWIYSVRDDAGYVFSHTSAVLEAAD